MNADYIRGLCDCPRRLLWLDAQRGGALRSQASTPGNYPHAESPGAGNHFLTDLSDSNESQCTAEESSRFGKLLLVPLAAAKGDYVIGNAPVQRQNQSEREFRHRD